jgi:hypothetical protein
MMDAALWDGPVADLSTDHWCMAPTLPLGAHRHAMRADADLSLPRMARLAQNAWAASTLCSRPTRPGSALHAGPTSTSRVSPGRHNGGTENVRPIVHDLHDQNTLSDHDSAR